MNRLLKIALSATPGTGLHFCGEAYGSEDIHRFLRDVLAMANAPVEGNRYIITGVDFDQTGTKRVHGIGHNDLSAEPSYQSLVADFIEPPLRVKYEPVTVDDKCVGVYEIGDCQDKPYMMRIDYSERLRRGDAYVRVKDTAIKMGRRMLLDMLETRPRQLVSADTIEIGFPGEIIHKQLNVPTVDLCELPSAAAHAKLSELIDVRERTRNSGSTTTMARLMHARLFGPDVPFEDRSPSGLMEDMALTRQRYEAEDQLFLFDKNAQRLQLVVFNQGDEPIQGASLSLFIPNQHAFYIAISLPPPAGTDENTHQRYIEFADYPVVTVNADNIHVSTTMGEIPTGVPVEAFESPLRICVGSELKGRRLAIRYKLFGINLRCPVEGRLTLAFTDAT